MNKLKNIKKLIEHFIHDKVKLIKNEKIFFNLTSTTTN